VVAQHAQARALVVPDPGKDFDHEAMAWEVAAGSDTVEHVLVLSDPQIAGSVDLRALCAEAEDPEQARKRFDAAPPAADTTALFLMSGGTTGLPKLIARTHNDFGFMATTAAQICGVGPDAVYLAALPLGHGFPMSGPGVLGTMLVGGRAVIISSPAPERAFAAIARERVTITSLVPAIIHRWLAYRATEPDTDLSSLRLLQSGGAHLPHQAARQIEPVLGCTLQQVYGMSEGLLCLTRPDDPPEVIWHSQGRPICADDEILLVDERGEPVAPGEPGVLWTRGPYTPRGYYRAAELNARAFFGDGWYSTGDIVRRLPDGNLIVEGREKDVINRGGEKIPAEEVENLAHLVPAVRMVAAVAMPDPELGERICLYVTPYPGTTVTLEQLRAAMENVGVARFKLPEFLVLVDDLPLTPVGKTDKRALRADLVERLATS
jgi:2,3-dihydroxybenzoate-AMP ligase